MGGKAAVLVVLGFSLIFLVIGHNFGNISNRSVDNFSDYYVATTAYNLAVSGANMAASEVFFDKTWDEGFTDIDYNNGKINVIVDNPNSDLYNTSGKVTICHIPPGNPGAKHTIRVSTSALPAHLAHGDFIGECGSGGDAEEDLVTIISEGTFHGNTRAVVVELRPSHFSKYGNYYAAMDAYPATGDTFHGPFHVNNTLTTYGTPVFLGKATSKKGLNTKGWPRDPKFYGGYESGIDIPLEFDTSGMRSHANIVFKDTNATNTKRQNVDVKIYFKGDGTADVSQRIGSDDWSPTVNLDLATLAPDGVIFVEGGNIFVKGTVKGAYTLAVSTMKVKNAGNIYIEDDLVYNTDPRINPQSKDILGLVAEQNIRILYNENTKNRDITTMASMFAEKGNIGPDDNLVSQNYLGNWRILGGLIANKTRVTAEYAYISGIFQPYRGLKFNHRYDQRFMKYVPPYFPNTKGYEVVSWYE